MLSKKIIWKFNIIDLLLIFIIVLSIAALIYKSAWGKKNSEYRTYTVTYVCDNTPIELIDKVHEGDICVDSSNGNEIGELVDLSYTPIAEEGFKAPEEYGEQRDNNDDNEDRTSPTPMPTKEPLRARTLFTTQVEAAETEHGIAIEKNTYLMGMTVQLVIGNTIFDVYISDIY